MSIEKNGATDVHKIIQIYLTEIKDLEGKLTEREMVIVQKYLNSVKDVVNTVKTNKRFRGTIEKFRYNPVPIGSYKEREIFKNIETYHVYEKDEAVNVNTVCYEVNKNGILIQFDDTVPDDVKLDNDVHVIRRQYKEMIYWTEIKDTELAENVEDRREILNREKFTIKKLSLEFHPDNQLNLYPDYQYDRDFYKVEGEIDKNLGRIVLPRKVNVLGKSLFRYCNQLTTIVMPEYLEKIEDFCFQGCSNLRDIEIPSTVTEIGIYAFYDCGITRVVIPSKIRTIKQHTFEKSGVRELVLQDGLEVIDNFAFSGCKRLMTIQIPPSVTEIRKYAFAYCRNLQRVYFDRDDLDYSCNIEILGDHCFYDDPIDLLYIPETVQTIYGPICQNLNTLVIPEDLDPNLVTEGIPQHVNRYDRRNFSTQGTFQSILHIVDTT